jgi:lysophospholipase L1-like esterase
MKFKQKNISLFLPLLASTLLSFSLLQALRVSNKQLAFEHIGLGEGTSIYTPKLNDHFIHSINKLSELEDIHSGWEERNHEHTLLWLGNSQLHGINQYKEGDRNAVEALHYLAREDGNDVIAFSLPNADLQEHYLVFEYFLDHFPLDQLLLPVFLDDTRENGIRNTLVDVPLNVDFRKRVSEYEIGVKILDLLGKDDEATVQGSSETAGIKKTIQEKAETALTQWLHEHSALWRTREQARGEIYLLLYNTRNKVFGIKPESVRKIIPANYQANLAAFEAILKRALAKKVEVHVYIPPIRQDISLPYNADEYTAFKEQIQLLCKKHRAGFINLEEVVPNQYWKLNRPGKNGASTLDFMHFEAEGHEILSDTLYKYLKTLAQ